MASNEVEPDAAAVFGSMTDETTGDTMSNQATSKPLLNSEPTALKVEPMEVHVEPVKLEPMKVEPIKVEPVKMEPEVAVPQAPAAAVDDVKQPPSLAPNKDTVAEEDDDDLEEGELKDDDDDDEDDDDDIDTSIQPAPTSLNSGKPRLLDNALTNPENQIEVQPKKKRKRVVRKVKRKIKVIKKVPKKKQSEQQPASAATTTITTAATTTARQPQQQSTNLLPINNNNNNNQQQHQQIQQPNNNQSIINQHPQAQRQMQHPQQISHTQPLGNTNTNTNNSNQLDSLWEQQIIMLQELQKQQQAQQAQQDQQHAQLLRAAATDEDLRLLQPPLLYQQQHVQPLLPHTQATLAAVPPLTVPYTTNIGISNSMAAPIITTVTNMIAPTNINTTTNSIVTTTPSLAHHTPQAPLLPQTLLYQQQQQTQMQLPLSQQQQQQPHQQQQQQQNLYLHQQHHHLTNQNDPPPQLGMPGPQNDLTPSSPDDDQGKSSYEAISKMLTLLRNSANVSDPSDMSNDLDSPANQAGFTSSQDENAQQSKSHKDTIEYSLVPVLVQGIDYTKYKLLSQYEPKFKNDPRLNQQA